MTTAHSSKPRRKTKIVATIGPSSRSPERVMSLIKAGANVFRLNFSHGSHAEHLEVLNVIREAAKQLNSPVAVLQDLSGPKIRISGIENEHVQIKDGDKISLRLSHGNISDASTVYVETLDPVKYLKAGDPVLLADGIISLEALHNDGKEVVCNIVKGGRLRSKVGIAFPESNVDIAATTEKDFKDLEWGIEHGVDYVAISFVRDASDIRQLKEAIKKLGGDAHIIAKIERKDALKNLDEIVSTCHGLMVARGDLGLELPLEQLPRVQKEMIEKANFAGIPVIVATQMLSSMVTSIRPTRAEVSDVAAAVMQGADAVMLSEETAIGDHPAECVKYLDAIAIEAEKTFEFDEYKLRMRGADHETVADAVAYAACAAANKVSASALVSCTSSGRSARLLAKYRPQQSLFGSSSSLKTLRRMNLYWGVTPIPTTETTDHHGELETALKAIREYENLPLGSRAVITGGLIVGQPGSTSVMEIKEIR